MATQKELAERERIKLLNRIRRIRGQMDAVERVFTENDDCADILMLLAAVRGGINSLMAEVMEDHIRLHLLGSARKAATPELAEDLIEIVRAYLK
ncbi:MAG TPA: metal/formaldehyde-sensitive transcriptional repressor [Acidobacteriaceae bacterium]|jgi:DNA-binding FrmR family transcriptional regulator|nr:metal/formaldehyde-sensitive transcriptional repressor [Acidobacteriaceae bacterium]